MFALNFFIKNLPSKHADLLQLVYDGHRFAQYFINTIEEHPLLLYASALPFTPVNTSIYKTFHRPGVTLPEVVCGNEKMWPLQLKTLLGHDDLSLGCERWG